MPKTSKARAVGLKHIALEVGDIEEALAFWPSTGASLNSLCGARARRWHSLIRAISFLRFRKGKQPGDDGRHFGLVVGRLRQHPVHQGATRPARHGPRQTRGITIAPISLRTGRFEI